MHIVLLTPGFASSEQDSTIIPALQVYLKKLRNSIPNATLTLIAFQFPYTTKPYTWNNIHVIPLNGSNKILKKIPIWTKTIQILNKLHLSKKIDTIHSFWIGECSSVGLFFARKNNINHVVTVMGQDAKNKNIHGRILSFSNTKIITISQNNQQLLLKNYNLKSSIIPWCLNKKDFPKLEKNTIDILGVGSLNTVKNYNEFIDIIFELKKMYSDIKVMIIGEGDQRDKIEKKIQILNLTQNIELTGRLEREVVLKKMSQSKILLHTSHYESFGYVFSEALYSGMHVVSNPVGTATSIKKWHICSTTLHKTNTCSLLLKNKTFEKERTLLHKNSNVLSYLKNYNIESIDFKKN